VYFCCLEALQNVVKYAGASHTVVRLEETDGALEFSVADDGAGFDPETTPCGAGTVNMMDRLEALGGMLEVWSRPGEGTVIGGRIPARRTLLHIGRR
jgi:signal transduction histidine kinase